MATYVMLMKLTEQGRKTIKESPARANQALELAKKMGGKVTGLWYTQGEYDVIGIAEWPNDEAVAAFALAAASGGNFTSQTLRGFSIEEMSAIVKKLP